ncbi:MAG TPA: HIT family protein [Gaiellaceae bacterium]|nr:HIT family protein [Gaiellaceae bacterium]
MHSHEPADYDCPFCRVVRGDEGRWNVQADVVWRGERTTAFVSPEWWPGNAGHVIVIPNEHVENLYGIDDDLLGEVYATVKRVAIALRECHSCAGTSTRQHNEPAGYQDVWHLHVHVFPRFEGDGLYARHNEARWVERDERAAHAERLRAVLAASRPSL